MSVNVSSKYTTNAVTILVLMSMPITEEKFLVIFFELKMVHMCV